jgi:esterase/lipase superfamily enzyme
MMRITRHLLKAKPVFLLPFLMMAGTSDANSQTTSADTASTRAETGPENGMLRTVPFLTLRNKTGSDKAAEYFGGERSSLSAGICALDRAPLKSLKPIAKRAPFHIPDEIVKVDAISELSVKDFWQRIEDTANRQAPVLYMHGFYISFERGCRRALLLKESLGLEGRFLLFSWPSDGAITNYTHDEADLYWSVYPLRDVLADMVDRFGGGNVNVVAHSLGTRGVVLALVLLAQTQRYDRPLFNQVVLIAPDIDVGIFEQYLPLIRPLVRNMTAYVSSNDSPLALSRQVHGHPRLGEAGEHLDSLQGIEIIDLSDVPRRAPSGHVYHLYQDIVIEDLVQIITENKPAAQRRNLKQVSQYQWRLQPVESE